MSSGSMHLSDLLGPNLVIWAEIFAIAVPVLLIPLVLGRRKEPASTIAWILTLVFVPVVGAVLFLLFGRDRIRWPARRKREADALLRAILRERAITQRDPSFSDGQLSDLERQIFQVGTLLTGSGATVGNRIDVLTHGTDVYDALGSAIDHAKHHINAEFYLIRNDETGAWFREKLARAAERGVEVRLLYDGYGCIGMGAAWARSLRRSGAKVGVFLPMRSLLLQPVNLRNHRKIVVVDGTVAFSGGVNIGNEYRGQMAGIPAWRDTHLRIEGPAASALQRVFLQDWYFTTGENLDPKPHFPAVLERAGDGTVAVVPSGPDTRTEAIHRLFFAAIAGAHERVYITTPYFVPDPPLVVALQVAAMRGVDVKLILPSRSNHSVTFHAGRSFYEQLLEAGVHIHEYTPGMIHAKTMLIDRHLGFVGSANMDMRSFRLNFEVHTVIHDGATARELEACFTRDLAATTQVRLDTWRARPRAFRVAEGAGRLFSPLL